MGIAASKKTLFAQHLPAPLLAYFAGNACRPQVREFHVAKTSKCDLHQLPTVASRVAYEHRKRNFPREITMATIRKGTKQFTRWLKNFREANKPPYKWYEHGTYVA